MKPVESTYSRISAVGKYRVRTILFIAIFWTLIDIIVIVLLKTGNTRSPFRSLLLREIAVFIMSCLMGYLFVYTLKNVFTSRSVVVNFIFKSLVMLMAAFLMNFLVHYVDAVFVAGAGTQRAYEFFLKEIEN